MCSDDHGHDGETSGNPLAAEDGPKGDAAERLPASTGDTAPATDTADAVPGVNEATVQTTPPTQAQAPAPNTVVSDTSTAEPTGAVPDPAEDASPTSAGEAPAKERNTRRRMIALAGLAVVILALTLAALVAYQNSATAAAYSHATATAQAKATSRWNAHLVRVATAEARRTATVKAEATRSWNSHLVRVATAEARNTTTAQAIITLTAGAQSTRAASGQATSIARAAAASYAQALRDAQSRADSQASATAQATIAYGLAIRASHPVRVCSDAHYNSSTVLCSQSDPVISVDDWDGAYLTYTTGKQTSFTSVSMHLAISEVMNSGSFQTLGTTDTNDTSLASSNESRTLSRVFIAAGVTPTDGTSYNLEADNGDRLLGVATFTYREQPAPTAVLSGDLAQAIFPPDSFFVLPADTAGGNVSIQPLPTKLLGWPATPRSRTEYDIAGSTLIYRVNVFTSAADASSAFEWQVAHLPANRSFVPLTQQDSTSQELYVVDNTLVDSLVIGNIELTASMPTQDQGDDVLTLVTGLAHALAQLPPTYNTDTTGI
jgi:hypothetical protein